jgi:hypothetical protein
MYWTSCEMFNRILQRKKYLCRSRALQIGLNLGVLEEWIRGGTGVGLPREVGSHFQIVKELVTWLQVGCDRLRYLESVQPNILHRLCLRSTNFLH